MIVDMGFVDVGADNIGVVALGESSCQLTAEPVGFLRCNLAGNKGLTEVVGYHIILAAHSAGSLNVLVLRIKKFGVYDTAAALPACHKPSFVSFVRVIYIPDYIRNRLSHGSAFSCMQRHDACGCHWCIFTPFKKNAADAFYTDGIYGLYQIFNALLIRCSPPSIFTARSGNPSGLMRNAIKRRIAPFITE